MNIQPEFLLLVPIVIGLVEVVKKYMADRYAPLFALLFGLVGAFGLSGFSSDVALQGIVIGLTSIGLYSGTTNTLKI